MKKGLVLIIALVLSWAASAQYGGGIWILNSRAADNVQTLFYDSTRYALQGDPKDDFIILNDERIFYLASDTAMAKRDSLLQVAYRKVSVYINTGDSIEPEKLDALLQPDENLVKHEARIIRKDGSIRTIPNTYATLSGNLKYLRIPADLLSRGDQLDIVQTILTPLESTGIIYFRTAYPVQRSFVKFELPPSSDMVFSYYNIKSKVEQTEDDDGDLRFYTLEEHYTDPAYHLSFDIRSYEKALGYTIKTLNNTPLNVIDEKLFTEWIFAVVNNIEATDTKWVDEFLNRNGILKITDKREQVRAVEKAVKKLMVEKKDGLVLSFNHPLISQKIAQVDKAGTLHIAVVDRILMLAFDQLKIAYEIYVARNKYLSPYKEDLSALENRSSLLFFFPEYKGYISPSNVFYRFPYAESLYLENEATLLDLTSYKGVKGMVPEESYLKFYGDKEANSSTMNYQVSFRGDITDIRISKSSAGEFAMMYAGNEYVYNQLAKAGMADFKKNYIMGILNWNMDTTVQVKTLQYDPVVINTWSAEKQYDAQAVLESRGLVTRAGSELVFDVGRLIGQQDSIPDVPGPYDVVISFPHSMDVTIAIDIPAGYEVVNLKDFETALDYKQDGLYYIRTARVAEGKLLIDIREGYTALGYPKKDYEKYKQVINAAHRFNNMKVIMQQK